MSASTVQSLVYHRRYSTRYLLALVMAPQVSGTLVSVVVPALRLPGAGGRTVQKVQGAEVVRRYAL